MEIIDLDSDTEANIRLENENRISSEEEEEIDIDNDPVMILPSSIPLSQSQSQTKEDQPDSSFFDLVSPAKIVNNIQRYNKPTNEDGDGDDDVILLDSDNNNNNDNDNSFINQAIKTSQLSDIPEFLPKDTQVIKNKRSYYGDCESDSDSEIEFDFTQKKSNKISNNNSNSNSTSGSTNKIGNSFIDKLNDIKKRKGSLDGTLKETIIPSSAFKLAKKSSSSSSNGDGNDELRSLSSYSSVFSRKSTIQNDSMSSFSSSITDNNNNSSKPIGKNKVNQYNKYTDLQLSQYLREVKLSNPKLLSEVNKINKSKADFLPIYEIVFDEKLYMDLENEIESSIEPMSFSIDKDCKYPIILFKRRVKAEYLCDQHLYVPVPNYYFMERTILLYYKAIDFVDFLQNNSFELVFNTLKIRFGNDIKIIIVINGLENYFQKIKIAQNNYYRLAVREQLGDINNSKKTNKQPIQNFTITQEEIMKKLSDFTILLGIKNFQIKNSNELIDWIKSFAFAMSQSITEKSYLYDDLTNIGTIKSGSNQSTTFLESIKQIKGISDSKAKKFCEITKNFNQMIKIMNLNDSFVDNYGEKLLRSDCETRLRRLFTSTNPDDLING